MQCRDDYKDITYEWVGDEGEMLSRGGVENLVDIIFEDFYQRRCGNCAHYKDHEEFRGIDWISCSMLYAEPINGFHADSFTCSEFERRT